MTPDEAVDHIEDLSRALARALGIDVEPDWTALTHLIGREKTDEIHAVWTMRQIERRSIELGGSFT